MTESQGIRVRRGTRQAWVAENEGKFVCACGCAGAIPLRPEHFNVGVPRYLHGHNRRTAAAPAAPAVRCECGCGDFATPGRRFISGHNNRGQKRSDATRLKLSEGKRGALNPQSGKRGDQSASWKGGRQKHAQGYILVYAAKHPFARKRYVMEHRLVAEDHLRETDPASPFVVEIASVLYLRPDVDVHHINEITDDNRLENLEVMEHGDHTRHHLPALVAARWPR